MFRNRIASAALFVLGIPLFAQVSYEQLRDAQKTPENWLTYSGSYLGQRYSGLSQVTPANAKDLEVKWVFQGHAFDKFETTPLVVDGVMYLSEPPNDVVALDAQTGRIFWRYDYPVPNDVRVCCGRVNRGVALMGDAVYMGTLDCQLVALDAKTGSELWKTQVCDYKQGYALTSAPLAVKDKIVIGTAGGEFGIRGYLAAYDAKSGREAWRFYTIPEAGKPGNETWKGDTWRTGGGSIWVTGSFDPQLNLIYWGTGNPGPDWNPEARPGDNLYTDCAVALDADGGQLKWYFQFTPHDEWDFDAVQVPVLADLNWRGQPKKVVLWANRNGFFYVLDRTTGTFLFGKPFVKQTWAKGLDQNGKPIKIPGMAPTERGKLVYPGVQGGTNWFSPSFSPVTSLFYVIGWEDYWTVYYDETTPYVAGQRFQGGAVRYVVAPSRRSEPDVRSADSGYGALRAIDPQTGNFVWEFKMKDVSESGLLSTASNVLFAGTREGHFIAFDARNGNLLWRRYLGGQIVASPMTYQANGRQFVVVISGNSVFTVGLREP